MSRQQVYYFGTWDNPQAANDAYLAQKSDLLSRWELSKGDGFTFRDLIRLE
jgi:hypothetical protein